MSPSDVAPPRDRSRRRRKAGKAGESDEVNARTQIIDAAIASILEVGFYRSSTNEIARRANVSWGALQYHFGTREALLLAIVQEIDRRFADDVEQAELAGDTLEERIGSLYQLLARHYDSPTFLVRLQIVLNLQHDPDTSAEVMAEVADLASRAEASLRRLLREALGASASRTEVSALFHALRGFAFSRRFAQAIPVEGSGVPGPAVVEAFLGTIASGQPEG
jgi:AcrR family transcriptional regulator